MLQFRFCEILHPSSFCGWRCCCGGGGGSVASSHTQKLNHFINKIVGEHLEIWTCLKCTPRERRERVNVQRNWRVEKKRLEILKIERWHQ